MLSFSSTFPHSIRLKVAVSFRCLAWSLVPFVLKYRIEYFISRVIHQKLESRVFFIEIQVVLICMDILFDFFKGKIKIPRVNVEYYFSIFL